MARDWRNERLDNLRSVLKLNKFHLPPQLSSEQMTNVENAFDTWLSENAELFET